MSSGAGSGGANAGVGAGLGVGTDKRASLARGSGIEADALGSGAAIAGAT